MGKTNLIGYNSHSTKVPPGSLLYPHTARNAGQGGQQKVIVKRYHQALSCIPILLGMLGREGPGVRVAALIPRSNYQRRYSGQKPDFC